MAFWEDQLLCKMMTLIHKKGMYVHELITFCRRRVILLHMKTEPVRGFWVVAVSVKASLYALSWANKIFVTMQNKCESFLSQCHVGALKGCD